MTNPTATAQATVLTEEQLANIESTLDTYVQHHRKVDTEWARTMAMNVVRSHRALTEQVRVLHDRIEAFEVQLAAMSDYVGHLTTQLTEARNALQELEHRAFRYTLDAEPFWGIEDDVMQRLRLALSSLDAGS